MRNHLSASLLLLPIIFTVTAPHLIVKNNRTSSALVLTSLIHKPLLQTKGEPPNLTQIHIIYCNVYVVDRSNNNGYININVEGPYKQTAWLVLNSPWKPLQITSNNTQQTFVELSYNPENDSSNPISETDHAFAWSIDSLNQVLFVKLQLTSTVTVTVLYYRPSEFPQWIPYAIVSAAIVISVFAIYIYKRRKTKR